MDNTFKYAKNQTISAGVPTVDNKERKHGIIRAQRKTDKDPENCYLVKFKGDNGLYQVYESKITP